MMSNRAAETVRTEDQAAAMLKAVALTMVGGDALGAFAKMPGHAMARGHAWRAIKFAIGTTAPVIWQRKADRATALAMLSKAIAFSAVARNDHPGAYERMETADRWVAARRLSAMGHKVEKYIAARLAGVPHEELAGYRIRIGN